MTDDEVALRRPHLAVTWEEAKGKLRAMKALQGSYPADTGHAEKYELVRIRIESFIKAFEDDGLHE